jgi:hypothetical protein
MSQHPGPLISPARLKFTQFWDFDGAFGFPFQGAWRAAATAAVAMMALQDSRFVAALLVARKGVSAIRGHQA